MKRGQIMVELAVALPFLMLLILGATEAGFLLTAKARQDRSTAVLADWAAEHPAEPWHAVAEHELPGCSVTMTTPLPDLVQMTATCRYRPVVLKMWDGLPMTSTEESAIRRDSPGPTPAGSESSSSTMKQAARLASTSVPSPSRAFSAIGIAGSCRHS